MGIATAAPGAAAELGDAIVSAAGTTVTVADGTALVSRRHPHQIITDIWVRREAGWRLIARHASTA